MLLEMNQVKKQYGAFTLECSLTLEAGQITGLIGQNGAGKSTTFKSILGLIKTDSGTVKLFGKDVKKLSNAEKEDIGVVLADSGFSSYLMIKDIVPILKSMYTKFDGEKFTAQCNHFGLPMNKQIKEFSTGMKAKLKLLVAMSHEAKLLILDEPTAGLDVIARDELLDLLREYMEKTDCAVLISSHISGDLEGLCDDLYMIHDGKMILHEETDILLGEYAVLKVTEEQYQKLDRKYILREKKEGYGYSCLTNQKQFYLENYPQIAIEKGSIDDTIVMMLKGQNAVKEA